MLGISIWHIFQRFFFIRFWICSDNNLLSFIVKQGDLEIISRYLTIITCNLDIINRDIDIILLFYPFMGVPHIQIPLHIGLANLSNNL